MIRRWMLVDTGFGTGAFNMAFDEQLTAAVAAGERPTTLRFFQWRPFCISLGRHQRLDDVNADRCRQEGIDVVYRPTGGRAILHAEELTYSVAFRDDIEGSVEETYYRISTALALGLQSLGVPAELSGDRPDLKSWYLQPSSASCFASSVRHEVQVAGRKIIGSAQKRYSGATLQHGSILIGPHHRRLPEFLRLDENRQRELQRLMTEKTTELDAWVPADVNALKRAMTEAFEEVFHITFEKDEWRAEAGVRVHE